MRYQDNLLKMWEVKTIDGEKYAAKLCGGKVWIYVHYYYIDFKSTSIPDDIIYELSNEPF